MNVTTLLSYFFLLNFWLVSPIVHSQEWLPKTPTVNSFEVISLGVQSDNNSSLSNSMGSLTENNNVRKRNQMLIQEVKRNEQIRSQQQRQLKEDISEFNLNRINYSLPSYGNVEATAYYQRAFESLNQSDTSKLSVKDINFKIENAFYEDQLDKAQFDQTIKNIGQFLTIKMEELGYDKQSNSAKNFMLFQFFSDTLKLKNGKEHLPFKYDFEDYMGIKDYSKMFVSKLLATQTGQCHSMPMLYLILAEEIDAEAYLAYSPNHSYIRFQADSGKWYNIELTNGMFSTTSYILQSGFIKSEALQNKIYMQNLSNKELFSQFYIDLANGYIHKFGYDEFVAKIIDKALKLSPNSIGANMVKANLDTQRFMYVMEQLNINPNDRRSLQNIKNYPKAVSLLNQVNHQYDVIDNLGYSHMPAEAYQDWLQSMKAEKNKQDDQLINEQFKGLMNKQRPKN